jgi:hypothetical protein
VEETTRRLCPAALVNAPSGLRRRRMELGGQIQRWRWCAHGSCARRPIGGGAAAGRGGSGSAVRAAWEAQRPRLLLLPPSPFWLRRWWFCGERGGFWSMEVLNGGVRRGGLEGLRPRQLPPPHSPLLFFSSDGGDSKVATIGGATVARQAAEREGQPGRLIDLDCSPFPPPLCGAR